jgi:cytochrome P450
MKSTVYLAPSHPGSVILFRKTDKQFQGPIVRITPYEVHIDDPAFFNELYNVTKKLDKDPWYYQWLDRNGSIFATVDSDVHKMRSAVIKKAFSTSSISKVEHVIRHHIATFCRRLQECRESKTPVPMAEVYRALAVDVVSDLSLPEAHNLLETPDFGAAHSDFVRGVTELSLWNRHLLVVNRMLEALPLWFIELQGQTALNVVNSVNGQKEQAVRVIRNNGKAITSKSFPVIMNEVYKSDLPPQEKTQKRLYEEIAILIGAGSETTGHALATITCHVLEAPQILKKLRDEIFDNFSKDELQDVLSYKRLENLPYLNACISEGLRLATSVSGRLPRINHAQPTTYIAPSSESYVIPAGFPISMSLRDLHYNASLYPNPTEFNPERWLNDDKARSEKGFVAFGRGARSCVGRQLAMAELQMAIANLFGRFDVKLQEGTSRRDVDMIHDCFSAYPVRDNNNVTVEIVG